MGFELHSRSKCELLISSVASWAVSLGLDLRSITKKKDKQILAVCFCVDNERRSFDNQTLKRSVMIGRNDGLLSDEISFELSFKPLCL